MPLGSERPLPHRTVLAGRYIIRTILGAGCFGMTYRAYDMKRQVPVAIREFLPRDFVKRDTSGRPEVVPYDEKRAELFEEEKVKFIKEARRLMKLRKQSNIVHVKCCFKENNTVYMVMKFVDGETLRKIMENREKPFSVEEVLTMLRPVMKALDYAHQKGILHQAIYPESIKVSEDDGEAYLLNFGTGKLSQYERLSTLPELEMDRYVPIEWGSSCKGYKVGPWTDVYSLCSVIYQCITGQKRLLQGAVWRVKEDTLLPPSRLGIEIAPQIEEALMQGLAVMPEDRIRSVAELMDRFWSDK